MLKIGWKASAEQFEPRPLVEYAVLAEELGYDSVVVSDHFHPWRHDGGHSPFSFAWLAAVGERTSRIALGTSVVAPAYRYHPAIVAQAMATLGVLYPKRVFLGVGTGEALNEIPLGVEWPEQKVRFQMLKEACLLIQRLWREDRVTFEGEFFKTDRATIYDKPEEPIPLYIAAAGPAAARLAGRIADGFITTSGKDPALYAEKLLPAVREGIEKAGRSPGEVELMLEVKVSLRRGPGARAGGHTALGGAGAHAGGEGGRGRPDRDAAAGGRAAGGADGDPLDRLATIPSTTCPRCASTWSSASPTWSSTSPGPTRSEPSADTASTWCPCCTRSAGANGSSAPARSG